MKKFSLFPISIFCLLSPAVIAFAQMDLSMAADDITLSRQTVLAGDTVRIYVRVVNSGASDAVGSVDILVNDKKIGSSLQVSVKVNTYDDVFVDWQAVAGQAIIQARITQTMPTNATMNTMVAISKTITVDADSNHNGLSDATEVAEIKKDITVSTFTPSTEGTHSTVAAQETSFFDQFQTTFEDFANSNPVKSALDQVNQTINAGALKVYHLAFGGKSESSKNDTKGFDLGVLQANLNGFLPGWLQNKSPWFYAGLLLTMMVLVFSIVKLLKRD